jgi:hypothetical protein
VGKRGKGAPHRCFFSAACSSAQCACRGRRACRRGQVQQFRREVLFHGLLCCRCCCSWGSEDTPSIDDDSLNVVVDVGTIPPYGFAYLQFVYAMSEDGANEFLNTGSQVVVHSPSDLISGACDATWHGLLHGGGGVMIVALLFFWSRGRGACPVSWCLALLWVLFILPGTTALISVELFVPALRVRCYLGADGRTRLVRLPTSHTPPVCPTQWLPAHALSSAAACVWCGEQGLCLRTGGVAMLWPCDVAADRGPG